MSPIYDVGFSQAAREDAIGLKIGAAPSTQARDDQVFSTRHRLHFTRVEYAIANDASLNRFQEAICV